MSVDSLIDCIETNKYADLKQDFETIIKSKIDDKIEVKKEEILNTINGVKQEDDDENEFSVYGSFEEDNSENKED